MTTIIVELDLFEPNMCAGCELRNRDGECLVFDHDTYYHPKRPKRCIDSSVAVEQQAEFNANAEWFFAENKATITKLNDRIAELEHDLEVETSRSNYMQAQLQLAWDMRRDGGPKTKFWARIDGEVMEVFPTPDDAAPGTTPADTAPAQSATRTPPE